MPVAKIVNVGSLVFQVWGPGNLMSFMNSVCLYSLISVLRYSALHDAKTQNKTTVSIAGIKTTNKLILWM
jgi:hypothetical protein